jgi:hypothetical protein
MQFLMLNMNDVLNNGRAQAGNMSKITLPKNKVQIQPSSAWVFIQLAGLPLYEILQFQCTTNKFCI